MYYIYTMPVYLHYLAEKLWCLDQCLAVQTLRSLLVSTHQGLFYQYQASRSIKTEWHYNQYTSIYNKRSLTLKFEHFVICIAGQVVLSQWGGRGRQQSSQQQGRSERRYFTVVFLFCFNNNYNNLLTEQNLHYQQYRLLMSSVPY